MRKGSLSLIILLLTLTVYPQRKALDRFLADSSMKNASLSLSIITADSGKVIFGYNSTQSRIPGSVLKLFISSAALEKLGPDYTFRTIIGYSGNINKRKALLNGDILIRGGGDPALGSEYFDDHYNGFADKWTDEIKKLGIRKIDGRIITDDSYYDYQPVPAKWLWEDLGNYYGAGVYGLSAFDNTCKIHLETDSGNSTPKVTGIIPSGYKVEYINRLKAEGSEDKGNVYAAPYSSQGWMEGSVPAAREDFVLKASITDPPLLMAEILTQKLISAGIRITGEPSTTRLSGISYSERSVVVAETVSPPLKEILEVLDHESVNLYAEHLLKELGKKFTGQGSSEAGIKVVYDFLSESGITTDGVYIEDASGVSPLDAATSESFTQLLFYMNTKAKYHDLFRNLLPEAGKEGTLKNYFTDPVFENSLRAKSGSLTRVRNYAGYIKTSTGSELIFCIMVNNFSGASKNIIAGVESILKETIVNN